MNCNWPQRSACRGRALFGRGAVWQGSQPNARFMCRQERNTSSPHRADTGCGDPGWRRSPRTLAGQRTLPQGDIKLCHYPLCAVLLFFLFSWIPGAWANVPAKTVGQFWRVRLSPAQIVNGAPVMVRVVPPVRLKSLAGKLLEHELFFSYDPTSRSWFGIAGVSLETRPGSYPLFLNGSTISGSTITFRQGIGIRKGKYRSIAVTVAKRFTEPSSEQLERINQEKTVKQDLFGRVSAERQWYGVFRAPVDAPVSDVFGTRRMFNGKVQSTHRGLDYAVPQGTPVLAMNSGTVLLARPMFFEGNCVMLDHGEGLLTMYLHFSEIKVKEGEHVQRGQELGLSGGTGRATGPHLHIAVRWQGIYLNPATLLAFMLPSRMSESSPDYPNR
jgi:murein DD-endopeptidase MepM/ murein hydrolase activator NlpD